MPAPDVHSIWGSKATYLWSVISHHHWSFLNTKEVAGRTATESSRTESHAQARAIWRHRHRVALPGFSLSTIAAVLSTGCCSALHG